jgi:hypothetical protein
MNPEAYAVLAAALQFAVTDFEVDAAVNPETAEVPDPVWARSLAALEQLRQASRAYAVAQQSPATN